MKCSKCGGKLAVKDTVHNVTDNEVYRKRVCPDCSAIIFTTEFEVETDKNYLELYNGYHRLFGKSRSQHQA